ncbi:MAG: hypothetical protein R3F62_24955 [Planctomycetota bacterium]
MTAHASLKSDASPADAPRATPHPVWLAALLCLLAAALVRPTLRAFAPEVAVSVWLAGDEIDDPWGRPYAERFVGPRSSLLYSVGPNGVDEQLTGDDLPALQQEWHCLIAGTPTFLVLAALLLAWTRVPTWRRPRGPLGQEVLRSLALASAPALSLAWQPVEIRPGLRGSASPTPSIVRSCCATPGDYVARRSRCEHRVAPRALPERISTGC